MAMNTNPNCEIAEKAAINAVNNPVELTINFPISENGSIGEILTSINTPAVTIVAACINALAGVGPSIASGSQLKSGNCADLPKAPIIKQITITVRLSILPSNTFEKTLSKLKVPKV